MGNCCGKPGGRDGAAFQSPGRVLGSAPPVQAGGTAPVPASAKSKAQPRVGGPPRTLGGSEPSGDVTEARKRAAEAAEARAKSKPVGKLGEQLQTQRKQTMSETLNAASAEERRRREIDATNEAINHN